VDDGGDKERVLAGLATAVANKGYAATTIADIVRHARVSKRTFYEHFDDKEACFLTAYRRASSMLQELLVASQDRTLDPGAQIRVTLHTYVQALELDAAQTRTFLLEIYAAGPRALAVRREVHEQFAALLLRLTRAAARGVFRVPSAEMTAALVGGVHELVLIALERGQPVSSVLDTAVELVAAVLVRK
jgi:AcrR family transcriptional regulator